VSYHSDGRLTFGHFEAVPAPGFIGEQTITFLTVPKPQKLPDQIQMAKLCLSVWLTYPFIKVVMFTNESDYDPTNAIIPYICTRFGAHRIRFVDTLPTGYDGRPLIREWFKTGMSMVQSGFICFINGDIIPLPQWMNAARRIFKTFQANHLHDTILYGTRSDCHRDPGVFDIDIEAPDLFDKLDRWLERHVRSHNPWGLDAVLLHSSFTALNWDELPDFVVGMCVWDNYFMGWANVRVNTVTMDFNVHIFHVDHPPNACNDSNYYYFRMMSARSRHFAGFQEHDRARRHLDLKNGRINGRFGAEGPVKLAD
jgi:hypothetical protein